jgi:predicted transcriptional regulator
MLACDVIQPHGLGPVQLDVLDSLVRGRVTVPEIAEDTGRTEWSIQSALDGLRFRRLVDLLSIRRYSAERGSTAARWAITYQGRAIWRRGR